MPHAEIRKWTLTFSHVQALSGTQTFFRKQKNRLWGINSCYQVNKFSNRCDCCTGWFCTCTFNSARCPVLQAEPWNMQRLVKADTPPFSSRWPETGAVLSRRHCHIQMKLLHFQLKGNVREYIPQRLWATECVHAPPVTADSRSGKNAWNPASTLTVGHRCSQQR